MGLNVLGSLLNDAKNQRVQMDAGMEAIAEIIRHDETSVECNEARLAAKQAMDDVDHLLACASSFETYGYDQSVMAVLNKDGKLDKMCHITPADILHKTPQGLTEVYQAGIFDAIKELLVAAWRKLIGFIKTILDWLKQFFEIFNNNRTKAVVDIFEKNKKDERVRSYVPAPTCAYPASVVFDRMHGIEKAIEYLSRLELKKGVALENNTFPSETAGHIMNYLGRVGIGIFVDGSVKFDQLTTEKGKSIEDLGWCGDQTTKLNAMNVRISKMVCDLQDKVFQIQTFANEELKNLQTNTNMPDDKRNAGMLRMQTKINSSNFILALITQLGTVAVNTHKSSLEIMGSIGSALAQKEEPSA